MKPHPPMRSYWPLMAAEGGRGRLFLRDSGPEMLPMLHAPVDGPTPSI